MISVVAVEGERLPGNVEKIVEQEYSWEYEEIFGEYAVSKFTKSQAEMEIYVQACFASAGFVYPGRSCYHDMSWTAWAISMKFAGDNQWPLLMT